MQTDFIIIGSGLAGLTSALVLKDFGEVLIITKGKLTDCATNLAQGGIAAAVSKEDSFDSHIKDTLIAGAFHNDEKAVESMVKKAPQAINWLVKQGVRFDKKNSEFTPTREAAHSYHRVLHATDFTGREVERMLVKKVKQEENIHILENTFVRDLLVKNNICYGVKVIKSIDSALSHPELVSGSDKIPKPIRQAQGSEYIEGQIRHDIMNIFCRTVILATGGLGQLYEWTTNPEVATGDGIALAYRTGAEIKDLEFIQFHPTALALRDGKSPLFLLSEALRGEGAYLVKIKNPCLAGRQERSKIRKNQKGERFMGEYDKRLELAPRDIVARAIYTEQKRGYEAYLDIRHRGEKFLQKRFPNISLELKRRGFDLSRDLIPVTPAAHYSCGGIKTDLYGRTNIKNLFAFGEVACTGVHGANRLASNSLLEAVVFPLRLASLAQSKRVSLVYPEFRYSSEPSRSLERLMPPAKEFVTPKRWPKGLLSGEFLSKVRKNLQRLMWEKVGIVRRVKELKSAKRQIEKWEKELEEVEGLEGKGASRELLEVKNMLLAAKLVTEAALKRKKSLGAHWVNG
jgi:L-aspartate oxidase